MKLLLLCLGLTLVSAHDTGNHDLVTRNPDLSKMSGEWYSILFASDVKEKVEENGSLRVFVETLQYLGNSSLAYKGHVKVNGQCTDVKFVAFETDEKGVFRLAYDGYNQAYVVEIDYSDYIVIFKKNFNSEKEVQLLELFARKPDVSPELKERFCELTLKHGIPKENIVDATKGDRCFQYRGRPEVLASSAA